MAVLWRWVFLIGSSVPAEDFVGTFPRDDFVEPVPDLERFRHVRCANPLANNLQAKPCIAGCVRVSVLWRTIWDNTRDHPRTNLDATLKPGNQTKAVPAEDFGGAFPRDDFVEPVPDLQRFRHVRVRDPQDVPIVG